MRKKNDAIVGIKVVSCEKCGQTFVPAPFHRFKVNGKFHCKWTCYNHRNDKPKEVKEDEKIIGNI
jgi:hypothetical protein